MKNFSKIFSILFIVIVAFSCKRKEPTRWTVDGTVPIAYGKITVADLIPDSLLNLDDEGVLHFVINEELSDFNMDSLVTIPDTTFSDFYGSPFISIDVTQGNSVFLLPIGIKESEMNINTAELKHVIAKSGFINYTLKNYVGGEILATYELPLVTKDGQTVYIEEIIGAGSENNPTVVEGSFDLTGFDFDLTGLAGDNHNIMVNDISVLANEDFHVPSQDTIFRSLLSFDGASVAYARGFFGQHTLDIQDTIDISAINNLVDGSLGIGEIDVNLKVVNYVGIDGQINFGELTSLNSNNEISITLDNPDLSNTINLTRAEDQNGNVIPSSYELALDEENSNIDLFIENLPNQIKTDISININPLGDISLGNDFIYTDQALEALLEIDLPLCVTMDNLTFRDTLDIDLDSDIEANGFITIYLTNNFPLSAEITAIIINENGEALEFLLNQNEIPSGIFSSIDNQVVGVENSIKIPITSSTIANLNDNAKVLFEVKLNSYGGEEVKFTPAHNIEIKIIAQAATEISYD